MSTQVRGLCGDREIVFAGDLKNVRKIILTTYELTPAVLSNLHRQQSSRPPARAHIFGANYGEVTAWRQISKQPVWKIPRNQGKYSVAAIGSKLRENANRSPNASRHIFK